MEHIMTVELDKLQDVLSNKTVYEQDDRFALPLCLGGGQTLVLTAPKELPINAPDVPFDPFVGVNDLAGVLTQDYDGYENCLASVIVGHYVPASEDQPKRFDIETDDPLTAPEALVEIAWPLGQPPADIGLDSDFGQYYRAIACRRVDHEDPEATYPDSHGTDVWIVPLSALGTFTHEIAKHHQCREALAQFAVKRYLLEAPYYRRLLHMSDSIIDSLGFYKDYGDEALVIKPDCREDSPSIVVYYDQTHLRALANTLYKMTAPAAARRVFDPLMEFLADCL